MDRMTNKVSMEVWRRLAKRAARLSLIYAVFAADTRAYASYDNNSFRARNVSNTSGTTLKNISASNEEGNRGARHEDNSGNVRSGGHEDASYRYLLNRPVVLISNLARFAALVFQKLILTPVIYLGKRISQFIASTRSSYIRGEEKLGNSGRDLVRVGGTGYKFTPGSSIIPTDGMGDGGMNAAGPTSPHYHYTNEIIQDNIKFGDSNEADGGYRRLGDVGMNSDRSHLHHHYTKEVKKHNLRSLIDENVPYSDPRDESEREERIEELKAIANITENYDARGYTMTSSKGKNTVNYKKLEKWHLNNSNLIVGIDIGSNYTKVGCYGRVKDKVKEFKATIIENALSKKQSLSNESIEKESAIFSVLSGGGAKLGYSIITDCTSLKDGLGDRGVQDQRNEDHPKYRYLKKAGNGMRAVFDLKTEVQNTKYGLEQQMGYLMYASRIYNSLDLGAILQPDATICISVPDDMPESVKNSIIAAFQLVCGCGNNLNEIRRYVESFGGSRPKMISHQYCIVRNFVAACTAYQYENQSSLELNNKSKDLVLVDVGHSHTTVGGMVINTCAVDGKLVQPLTVSGLGGDLVNGLLYKHILEKIKERDPKSKVDAKAQEKIMKAIVSVKEKLSATGADTVELKVDDILKDDVGEKEDFECTMSVDELNEILENSGFMAELEKVCRDYFEKLKNSGIVKAPEIAILGGTARIPLIQAMLSRLQNEYFAKGELNRTMNMDEFGTNGAVYAAADGRNVEYCNEDRREVIGKDILQEFIKLKAISEANVALERFKNDVESMFYNYQEVSSEDKNFGALQDVMQVLYDFVKKSKSTDDIKMYLDDFYAKFLASRDEVNSNIEDLKKNEKLSADARKVLNFLSEGLSNMLERVCDNIPAAENSHSIQKPIQ